MLWHSGLCRLFTIRLRGYSLRFHPSALSAELWRRPLTGPSDEFFCHYLKPGDRVIDVGANIGALTLAAAAAVGPDGHVYAFEPHPRIFRFLAENVALNNFGTISVFNGAVGSRNGTVLLSDVRDDTQNRVGAGDDSIEVSQLRLDDAGLLERRIDLLKVDVEGYEKAVLEGSPRTLERTRCVYFESSEALSRAYGYSSEDVLQMLREGGFEVYRPAGEHQLAKVSDQQLSEEVENLFAIKDMADFEHRTGYSLVATQPARQS